MSHTLDPQAGHSAEGIHLPKPSATPLIWAAGFMLVAFGIIAGPGPLRGTAIPGYGLSGLGLLVILIATGGWLVGNIQQRVHASETPAVAAKFAMWCFLGTEVIIFGALIARVVGLMGELIEAHAPDLAVIACNTASVQVLPALRERYALPFVGTVPAIKPACAASQSKLVSVLGTEATVAREYTHALIRNFGQGCDLTLVGSGRLAALAEAAHAPARAASAPMRRGQPPVLVVDDSRLSREACARVLAAAGYHPITAEDGWEAWEMLGERRFEALVTDLEMPRVDGFELISRIRHDPTLRRLPIIVLSSRTSHGTRERAIEAGAAIPTFRSFTPSMTLSLPTSLSRTHWRAWSPRTLKLTPIGRDRRFPFFAFMISPSSLAAPGGG